MLGIMSNRNRRMLASCLGTSLLFILLLLASLEGKFEVERPLKIHMHEVRIYEPPPPPPPPPVEQNTQDSSMPSLTKGNAEDPVKLDLMALEVSMDDAIGVSGFGTGGPGGGGGLGDWGGGTWGTVALPELDNIPMVISAPIMEYPEQALDRNILKFEVKLHIVIDEMGRTYPIRILLNPFPSINEEILEFASKVRFTPPTKQGVPVKAEYLWPWVVFPE